jgi:hypothetical protein
VIGESAKWQQFLVTELGPEDLVLGLPWLRNINPEIKWTKGTMKINSNSKEERQASVE